MRSNYSCVIKWTLLCILFQMASICQKLKLVTIVAKYIIINNKQTNTSIQLLCYFILSICFEFF